MLVSKLVIDNFFLSYREIMYTIRNDNIKNFSPFTRKASTILTFNCSLEPMVS